MLEKYLLSYGFKKTKWLKSAEIDDRGNARGCDTETTDYHKRFKIFGFNASLSVHRNRVEFYIENQHKRTEYYESLEGLKKILKE